jgi:hypothetical protein
MILKETKNLATLLIFHRDFYPTLTEQPGRYATHREWMYKTNAEIMKLLENGSLSSLGLYARTHPWWDFPVNLVYAGPINLLMQIMRSARACSNLKKLDIALGEIAPDTYDLFRSKLTSLTSLTIQWALGPKSGPLWNPDQNIRWMPNQNLTHLQLRRCKMLNPHHIPYIIQHFPSLRHLLLSIPPESTLLGCKSCHPQQAVYLNCESH